jgi:hypothetical protein
VAIPDTAPGKDRPLSPVIIGEGFALRQISLPNRMLIPEKVAEAGFRRHVIGDKGKKELEMK